MLGNTLLWLCNSQTSKQTRLAVECAAINFFIFFGLFLRTCVAGNGDAGDALLQLCNSQTSK